MTNPANEAAHIAHNVGRLCANIVRGVVLGRLFATVWDVRLGRDFEHELDFDRHTKRHAGDAEDDAR